MRDTQISLEIRIGYSRLALRIRDDTYLRGGGSITAWPLLTIYADTRSIEYSYRTFDNHTHS